MGKVTLIHLSHRRFANGSAQHLAALLSPVRRSEAFAAVGFGGEAGAERRGSARRGSAQRSVRRFRSICKRLVFRLVRIFLCFTA